ncbi:cytochrome c oxidase subunit 1 [Borealophlyctis nickersoniae]|nr:cytochrome c oxidase subunit 1 [Borealophlyctis nickersoniae]
MDIIQGDPKGDESFVRCLLALAVRASTAPETAGGSAFPVAEANAAIEGSVKSAQGGGGGDQEAEGDVNAVLERILYALEAMELGGLRCYTVGCEVASKLRHTLQGLQIPANRKDRLDTQSPTSPLTKIDRLTDNLTSNLDAHFKRTLELESLQKEVLALFATASLADKIAFIQHIPRLPLVPIKDDSTDQGEAADSPAASDATSITTPAGAPAPLSLRHPPRLTIPEQLRRQASSDSIGSDASTLSAVDLLAFLKGADVRASTPLADGSHQRQRSTASDAGSNASGAGAIAGSPLGTPTTPKMFSKLPPEVLSAQLPKAELMRLSVVYELIETESDYVRDLNTMINYHKEQIKSTKLLTDEEIATLFSNLDQLVPVNQQLQNRLLEKRDANPLIPEVGDALVDVSESFKVYTTYCGNYPEAMKLVHSLQARADFKDHMQVRGRGKDFEKWIVSVNIFIPTPIFFANECVEMDEQRRGTRVELGVFFGKVLRAQLSRWNEGRSSKWAEFFFPNRLNQYPLLIRELQKHTDKNSKDTLCLNLAMGKIEAVVAEVNEGTRQLGEKERIGTLEKKIETPAPLNLTTLRHLRDGTVQRVVNGKARERLLLLFVEAFIICKPLKGGKYQLESVFDVAEWTIKHDPSSKLRNALHLHSTGTPPYPPITFTFPTEEDRNKWSDSFAAAMKASVSAESKRSTLARQFSDINGEATGRSGGTLRFASGSDRMSTSRKGSVRSGGSGLRPKSWTGSVRQKKGVDFSPESETSMMESLAGGLSDPLMTLSFLWCKKELPVEPDMVSINGQIWKRTLSAMGQSYYYNTQTKETTWRLPDPNITPVIILDPATGKPLEPAADEGGAGGDENDENESDEEDPQLEVVEGFPDWRKVDRGDGVVYYCNLVTSESRWTPPV